VKVGHGNRGANGQTDFSVETSFPAAIAIILYIRELCQTICNSSLRFSDILISEF